MQENMLFQLMKLNLNLKYLINLLMNMYNIDQMMVHMYGDYI